jgi:hypothetical protein
MNARQRCSAHEQRLEHEVRALRIENDLLAATVLVDKGADIYQLISKPRNLDVLWKTPWGLRNPRAAQSTFGSTAAWLETCPGGWQEIFPSGGGPCIYKGVELNFHGEASVAAWDYTIVETGDAAAEVRLTTRLFRSPFRLERTMRVEAGRPVLILRERITNEGGEPIDYMWGHHPSYGPPFLSGACRIDSGAGALRADDGFDGPYNPLTPDRRYDWPIGERDGASTDLSRVPGPATARHLLAYFERFDVGWYGITNTALGLGVGLVWPKEIFPYAWFWQELHASSGHPWYRGTYVMAIEPFSSIPGQGLVAAMEKTGTHRTLAAGDSVEAELLAVFYESTTGVDHIEADGTVIVRAE